MTMIFFRIMFYFDINNEVYIEKRNTCKDKHNHDDNQAKTIYGVEFKTICIMFSHIQEKTQRENYIKNAANVSHSSKSII